MGLCQSIYEYLFGEHYKTDYEPPSAPLEQNINSPRGSNYESAMSTYSNYESAMSNSELSQSFRESLVQADKILSET